MAASSGVTEGSQVKLYYLATEEATFNEAAVNTIAVEANEVKCVTDLGAAETGFTVIEYSKYGNKGTSKIAGKDLVGDFTFDVAFDDSEPSHNMLRDFGNSGGKPTALSSFVVGIETSDTEKTFVAMQGRVYLVSLAPAVDGVTTMSVTVSLEDRPVFFVQA